MLLKKWLLSFIGCLVALMLVFLLIKNREETAILNSAARQQAPGKFINLGLGVVHYKIYGADSAKLLVLIHGGGTSGIEVWQYNIPYFLSKGYQILVYDLYGRGYSDRIMATYDLQLFRNQLITLLDTLRIKKPFDLIAMSMGAPIGLDYAANHPNQVKKVVLLGPAASGDLQPSPLLRIPLLSDFLMTAYWYPRAVENQRKEFVNQPLFDQYAKRLKFFMNFAGYKQVTLSTWLHMLNNNQLYLLKNISPDKILLIYGKQDPFFPQEKKAIYKSCYPTLTIVGIDSAGHMPHFEQPGKVNDLISRYLQGSNNDPGNIRRKAVHIE